MAMLSALTKYCLTAEKQRLTRCRRLCWLLSLAAAAGLPLVKLKQRHRLIDRGILKHQ
jgi:hypothetical protein